LASESAPRQRRRAKKNLEQKAHLPQNAALDWGKFYETKSVKKAMNDEEETRPAQKPIRNEKRWTKSIERGIWKTTARANPAVGPRLRKKEN